MVVVAAIAIVIVAVVMVIILLYLLIVVLRAIINIIPEVRHHSGVGAVEDFEPITIMLLAALFTHSFSGIMMMQIYVMSNYIAVI